MFLVELLLELAAALGGRFLLCLVIAGMLALWVGGMIASTVLAWMVGIVIVLLGGLIGAAWSS